jgi:hypothetical protein
VVKFTHTSKKGRGKNMKRFLIGLAMLGVGCSIDSGTTEGKEKAANTKYRVGSFLPENNYHERATAYKAGEVSEEDFDLIISAAQEIYGPIVESFGAELIINKDFDDDTVNAFANQDGNKWEVSFFGGLAKHKDMNFYGFSLVVCHELGHHLGFGVMYPDTQWRAAVEGQADYFATAACARKMFDQSSPLRVWGRDLMKKKKKPSEPPSSTGCTGFYGIDKEVCEVSLEGGLSLGRVLADLNGDPAPTYEKMDRSKIKKTQYPHPKAACRLATYYGGAVCKKSWPDSFEPNNVKELKPNACFEYSTCWLNEKNI